jgi:hypothetical protein
MRYRLLVASVSSVLALTFFAVPVAGQPPSGMATVSFTDNGACSVTVTYTWSGFKGRDLSASVGVVRSLGGGAELWLYVMVDAAGSGTASHTFDLTGRGSYTYYGGGRLTNAKGWVLGDSDVRSSTSANLSC